MVGIPVLVELLLVATPALFSVGLSFTRWDGLNVADIKPVGLANYQYAIGSYPPFWPAIMHNIVWLLALCVIAAPLGVALAVLLDRKIRGSRIYQSIFFAPVMMSLALVGIVWQLVYSRDGGLINGLLGTSGTPEAINWLGDPGLNLGAVLVAAIWKHAGYVMILYLSGLKGVDPALREAASLDGANGRQTFFRVILPAMAPINMIVIVITIIESLRAFDLVYVINGGTNGLELLSALIVQNLIGQGQVIGVGSALATILLVISLVPIIIYLSRAFRRVNE
jgi:multiple sugar transport system permease protein/raffinose/stachyose/melibiose transport system permease protein